MAKAKSEVSFDPKKQYSWEVDTDVVVSGATYGLMRHLCTSILNEEKYIFAREALNGLEEVLKKHVENGTFSEMVEAEEVE